MSQDDSPQTPPASITTTEKDFVNTRQMWVYAALAVILIGYGAFETTRNHWAAALLFIAGGLLAAFQAWTAFTTKDSVVTIDETGIRRAGGWGWKLPWDQIASATVEDYGGQDFLVVMRNWDAPNHQSSSLRFNSPFPKNALLNPLPYDLRDEVAAVAARYRPGPRAS